MLLIGHARAGERAEWEGDDRLRPLDERGRLQAERLVTLLTDYPVERILSSPYDRCVQTVLPLARVRRLPIEVRDELGEERQAVDGANLARELIATSAALCCHGGLSERVVAERQRKGEVLVVSPEARIEARLPG